MADPAPPPAPAPAPADEAAAAAAPAGAGAGADEKKQETGVVMYCGGTDYVQIGRVTAKDADPARATTHPILPAPIVLSRLASIPIAFVASGPTAMHALAGAADGSLYAWGRNDRGQLGLGDTATRNAPTRIDLAGRSAVAAAAGRSHTLIALADGSAVAAGLNGAGQLGVGSIRPSKGGAGTAGDDARLTPAPCVGIGGCTAVSAGSDFSMWLCSGGKLWSAGNPQYGVLGHGEDHEYNAKESSVKLKYAPQPTPRPIQGPLASKTVARVACGAQHTLALTADGCAYTWGNGGYGRLGHNVQQDEFSPRLVEGLTGRTPVDPALPCAAGSTASYCSSHGQLYAFGKLKVSGDNTMRPTPVMDVSGWTVTSIASGGATFVAAAESPADGDRAVVAWGHALNGELGFGAGGKKSSANPMPVDSLRGARVRGVAAGAAFTLYLVAPDDPAVKAAGEWASGAPDAEAAPASGAAAAAPPAAGAKRKAGAGAGGRKKK